jgi:hypothetical protein
VKQIAEALVAAGILSETTGARAHEPALQPAVDIRLISLDRVSDALEFAGRSAADQSLPIAGDEALAAAVREWRRAAAESPSNRLLKDIS